MAKRTKGTRLPRLTILAQSARELQRHSDAVEKIVTVSRDLGTLFDRFDLAVATLESLVDALEGFRPASKKRRAATARRIAGDVVGDQADAPPDGTGENGRV